MTVSRDVTDKQVDAAIAYVIDNGAIDRGQTISYSRVFDAAGLPPPQDLHLGGESQLVTRLMERFHRRCEDLGLPPLDALVVHVTGPREGRPGVGYFRINGYRDPFGERASAEQVLKAYQCWENQVNQCREWGKRRRRGQA